ncbi:hypothetical protein [Roseovarius aestuarii]|uniref:Uncharacterized protein n=1 Tax=Roseovarius aestuarii TaxID=475083 RepID=A0A1X7BW50_9RHOB|nr:hypothetical protein [Roseovarius aestuarii]SMC13735.1 hypothetical protein ROA7745_03594 [Roseovarius aestuarii]
MTQADQVRDIAAQAVSGADSTSDAQTRLNRAIAPLTPVMRLLAAQDHSAAIRPFVNPARIDIEVSLVTRGGDVINTGEGHET